MDVVLVCALCFAFLIIFPCYVVKFGRKGFSFARITLLLCSLSLIIKASGHVWCSDGAGRDHGGFDYSKGNANVITSILFLYGEMQYVWLFWNMMFLFFDEKWIKTAVRVHLFASIFMFTFILFLWSYIKEYPIVDRPVGGALRPGNYLWMVELGLPLIFTVYDIIKSYSNKNIKKN